MAASQETSSRHCDHRGLLCTYECYAKLLLGIVATDVKNHEVRREQEERIRAEAMAGGCKQL